MTEEVVGLHKRIIANSTTYLKIEIIFFCQKTGALG